MEKEITSVDTQENGYVKSVMTEKGFDLSKKEKGKDYCPSSNDKWFFSKDVKEFIQLLKELEMEYMSADEIRCFIDKLSGGL